MIGTKLAHYEITHQLGSGGMGDVWKAKDTTLGREVAIKTLPEEFGEDADRLTRFEWEAKLLASLNHPNIAAIYGLQEYKRRRFLVLELVEGKTLAERILSGPMPLGEALRIFAQVAEGLLAAHRHGVIHRDLKPANIMIGAEGRVKLLDFGLAKRIRIVGKQNEDFKARLAFRQPGEGDGELDAAGIAEHLRVENTVLDGEIACVDDHGPNFRELLFRQRPCMFIAFDLLYLNGKDLRILALIERKRMLKKLRRRKRSRILYLDHVEADGCCCSSRSSRWTWKACFSTVLYLSKPWRGCGLSAHAPVSAPTPFST